MYVCVIACVATMSVTKATDRHKRHRNEREGTNASMVKDIRSGTSSSSPRSLMIYNSKLYFFAYDGSNTNLYSYDGSSVSTVESDLDPPYYRDADYNYIYSKPIVFNNKLLFIAHQNYSYVYSLYSYDGN